MVRGPPLFLDGNISRKCCGTSTVVVNATGSGCGSGSCGSCAAAARLSLLLLLLQDVCDEVQRIRFINCLSNVFLAEVLPTTTYSMNETTKTSHSLRVLLVIFHSRDDVTH